MDYDLDIILISHFAERIRGGVPRPLGEFAQELFDDFDALIEARAPGLDGKQRSVIAALAFLAPGQTREQSVTFAVAEFVALNS